MKKSALILFIILVSASLFTFADDTAGGLKMGFEKINDRIFVVNNIEGYATRMVVLSGTKGLAIIDTAHTLEITQKAKEIIKRELGRDDYIYVVNTHGHYDHISGNQLFPGIPIIGHDLCVETVKKFASRKKEYIEYWGGQVDKAKEQLAATRDSKEAAELKHLILLRSMQVANLKGSEFVATPPIKPSAKR